MRAAVLVEKDVIKLEERPVPKPDPDQVLIKVASVTVCASDVHYYKHGRIGDYIVDKPLILGHEVSGVIVDVGSKIPKSRIGERVAIEPQRPCRVCDQCSAGRYNLCPEMEFYATPPIDGAFCDYVLIQSPFAYKLPDEISFDEGALIEPLSVGIWACEKGGVTLGSRVLITGAGPIGILTAFAAKGFGASEIIVSDPQPERRAQIMKLGAATSVIDPAKEKLDGLEVDAFIECSGAVMAIRSGIKAVRRAGAIVLVGMGADEVPLPLPVIQDRELILTGVFRYARTWPMAIDMIKSKRIDLSKIVTSHFNLDQTKEALDKAQDPTSIKVAVTPK
ncbi:NAD(P)-dependent alcohol dehydrogenase [Acetobacteraceae bacterium]|nr:NAD(P)-dependent alcohol dehydrogenase [Acetobacteraceae bacterium]